MGNAFLCGHARATLLRTVCLITPMGTEELCSKKILEPRADLYSDLDTLGVVVVRDSASQCFPLLKYCGGELQEKAFAPSHISSVDQCCVLSQKYYFLCEAEQAKRHAHYFFSDRVTEEEARWVFGFVIGLEVTSLLL